MPLFTKAEATTLAAAVAAVHKVFCRDVTDVLREQFRGWHPASVADFREQLSLLELQLRAEQNPVRVHDAHNRLLKRVIIDARRDAAEAIDAPLRRALDPDLVRYLHRALRPLEAFMATSWFTEASALRAPALTDYVSIRHAEAAGAAGAALAPRAYDEKFHILEAPSLFLPDLAYYRRKCALRRAAVTVAYLDIDDFKSFNTRLTETVVDLKVLAPFMELVEAHVFGHGHAYRFGGDEYVLLLPNMDGVWAEGFLRALQARVGQGSFFDAGARLSLSIGLCLVDVDCSLTDREVLAKANVAKNFVKSREKGRIASFASPLFEDASLTLVDAR